MLYYVYLRHKTMPVLRWSFILYFMDQIVSYKTLYEIKMPCFIIQTFYAIIVYVFIRSSYRYTCFSSSITFYLYIKKLQKSILMKVYETFIFTNHKKYFLIFTGRCQLKVFKQKCEFMAISQAFLKWFCLSKQRGSALI